MEKCGIELTVSCDLRGWLLWAAEGAGRAALSLPDAVLRNSVIILVHSCIFFSSTATLVSDNHS